MNSNETRVPVDIERFKAGEPIYGSQTGEKYTFMAVNRAGDHFCVRHLSIDVLSTITLKRLRDAYYMKPKTVTKWRAIVRNKHSTYPIYGSSTLYDSEEEIRRAWEHPDIEILECSPVTFPVD